MSEALRDLLSDVRDLVLNDTSRQCLGGCGQTKNIREFPLDVRVRLPICSNCLLKLQLIHAGMGQ